MPLTSSTSSHPITVTPLNLAFALAPVYVPTDPFAAAWSWDGSRTQPTISGTAATTPFSSAATNRAPRLASR